MSDSQTIISIGREYGSGGHAIAEELAKRLGLKLYDHNILDEVAREKGVDPETLRKYDEKPHKLFLSRSAKGYHSSAEVNVAYMQFDYLKKKAEKGESFIVVGRCAEGIFEGNPALISFFVLADTDAKIKRIMEVYELSKDEAIEFIRKKDKKRKRYHNYHCSGHWGDSRLYDLCINSTRLGIEKTVDYLESYIKARTNI